MNLQHVTHPEDKEVLDASFDRFFSLPSYLLSQRYEQVSPHLFVKDGSPEIIRVTNSGGRTFFRNFLVAGDKGSVLDFLCHRAHTPGLIIPNHELHCLQRAIVTALAFIGEGALPQWVGQRYVAYPAARNNPS